MFVAEALRMAMSSLWSHRTRSLLTILGVVIGIGSVLAVVSLSKSFEDSIVSQFDDLDTKSVFVSLAANETQRGPAAGQFSKAFTGRDVSHLLRLPGVDGVVPTAGLPIVSMTHGNRTLTFDSLTVTTERNSDLRDEGDFESGRVFRSGQPEMVLGNAWAQLLAGVGTPGVKANTTVPAGTVLLVRFHGNVTQQVTVSGVLKHQESLIGIGSTNSRAYVSVDPFYRVNITSPVTQQVTPVYNSLVILAQTVQTTDAVRDAARAYFAPGGRSDAVRLIPPTVRVQVATQGDITATISDAFAQVTLFIAAIAVVSLVVGAIGIANILLVSVTERTREIGVMKALGATDGQVLLLFLVEAMVVGLVGAVFGLALGLGVGLLLVEGVFAAQDVGFVVPAGWVWLSLFVGVGVGVVAGFLPARRATKIQPVRALAYD